MRDSDYLKRQIVVTDVMTDPLWADYRQLAQNCGLRACWSTPIISARNEVLGSFAIYRQENRGPKSAELALAQVATHITGIAIERKRAEEALREREERDQCRGRISQSRALGCLSAKAHCLDEREGRMIYGFRPDEMLTRDSLIKRVHQDDRSAVQAVFDRACAHFEAFENEHRLALPFGNTRWVIMRGRCLQDKAETFPRSSASVLM